MRQKFRQQLIRLVQSLLKISPYEIRNRRKIRAEDTLSALRLVMAYYRASGRKITILQIGACDGIVGDSLREFIMEGVFKAVLIEPNPVAFARLEQTYAGVPNVTLVQAAIAEKDGEAFLYRVKDAEVRGTEREPFLAYSSFDPAHMDRLSVKPSDVERIAVPTRTLSRVISETGLSQIDLLQIDVEGLDAKILRMVLDLPTHPLAIECEHFHVSVQERAEMFEDLQAADYLFASDAWNVMAVKTAALDEWIPAGASADRRVRS